MGVIVEVLCHTCKVRRDLDKFYDCMSILTTRDEAIAKSEDIVAAGSFKAGLLATFMYEHRGHNCTLQLDTSASYEDKYPYDHNFWRQPEEDFKNHNLEILEQDDD